MSLQSSESPDAELRRRGSEALGEPTSPSCLGSSSRQPAGSAQQEARPLLGLTPTPSQTTPTSSRRWLAAAGAALALAALSLLCMAAPAWAPGAGRPAAATCFVSVAGLQLEAHCRPFTIAGANVETLAQAPVARVGRRLQPGEPSGRQKVRRFFQRAAAAGINVVRTWAHTSDPHGEWVMQVAPGIYDEDAFRGLDFVVAEAGRAGVRLQLSLVDNWSYRGGVDEYVDWSPGVPPRDRPHVQREGDATPDDYYSEEHLRYEAARHALFFRDGHCKAMYRAHMEAVLLRRNSFTGLLYRDDPAILGYDLINELRCSVTETPDCPALVAAWLREMSDAAAALAPHQLILVGSDGFWAAPQGPPAGANASGKAVADPSGDGGRLNPGAWASEVGQDWIAHHALPNISLAALHLWPQQWQVAGDASTFSHRWLDDHVQAAAQQLRKPVLLEEFGHRLGRGQDPPEEALQAQRNPVFEETFAWAEAAYSRQGTALVGSLFWRWAFKVYPSDVPGPHGVAPSHSTFALVERHARLIAHRNAATPPQAECGLGCFVPHLSAGGLLQRCIPRPRICAAQRAQQGGGAAAASGHLPTYPSRVECCRPGLGAFARGCSLPW